MDNRPRRESGNRRIRAEMRTAKEVTSSEDGESLRKKMGKKVKDIGPMGVLNGDSFNQLVLLFCNFLQLNTLFT